MISWFKKLLLPLRNSFGKGYFPVAHELALRVALLRPILLVTGVASIVYLVVGWLTPFGSQNFPLDAIFWLIASGLSWILLRKENAIMASVMYIVIATQPLHYLTQSYGVASPINGLYLAGIILCGLLIGNWFVGLWTIWYGVWMTISGFAELTEQWTPSQAGWLVAAPIRDTETLIGVLAFWWGAFILMGWLVSLISRHLERTVVVAHGQTSALAHTLSALSAMPDQERFIGEALTATAEQLEAEWATLFFHDRETDTLAIHMGFGQGRLLTTSEVENSGPPITPSASIPVWAELLRTRQPVPIYDIANDPRLRHRALILSQGLQSLLYVPLLLGDEIPGFLSLNSTKPRRFSPQEMELAQALAQQISLALQLTRMGEQANQTAILRERNRMAREIHDTLAQGFTGIVIQLEAAEDMLTETPAAARDHLARARALARESLAEARRSVWALRGEHTPDLVSTLRRQAESLIEGTNLSVEVTQAGLLRPLPDMLAQTLLRIGQESLTNALRHAHAQHIHLHLSFMRETIELTVEDDGLGFDPESSPNGFGLTGMRERTEEMKGNLDVKSHYGKGTVVTARFPLEKI